MRKIYEQACNTNKHINNDTNKPWGLGLCLTHSAFYNSFFLSLFISLSIRRFGASEEKPSF